MKEPLDRIVKDLYCEEIDRIDVPLFPSGLFQAGIFRKKKRQLFFQAAVICIMLCILILSTVSAVNRPYNELAARLTSLGRTYDITQRIPGGIRKLQQIFCITFNTCK